MAYHTTTTYKEIRRLWADGKTSTQIANALGMTRGAVIGCVHRGRDAEGDIAWPTRRAVTAFSPRKTKRRASLTRRPPVKNGKYKTLATPKPRLVSAPLPKPTKPLSDPIAWLSRELNQCAFIPGDPRNIDSLQCCGAPTMGESSYCSFHHDICCIPDDRRSRRGAFKLPRIGAAA